MISIIPEGKPGNGDFKYYPMDVLSDAFFPRELQGVVNRAGWFVLMERLCAKKGLVNCLGMVCICCNMHTMIMQMTCAGVNSEFEEGRPIYRWTKDNQLALSYAELKTRATLTETKGGRRNSSHSIS